jgi:histone-lysine N-methyltransferase SETD2
VVDKFHGKLPKDEIKKFAREVNKKLVASDYKNKRVEDPTSISSKQAKKVRKYAHDFFDRAVVKYTDHEKKKTQSASKTSAGPSHPDEAASSVATPVKDAGAMSDIEGDSSPRSSSSGGRKRKRDDRHDDDRVESPEDVPSETPSVKRVKEDDVDDNTAIPSPPPPPPPPVDSPPAEEDRSMREQEEALMRENEEAQRLEDEAQAQDHGGKQNGFAAAKKEGAMLVSNGSAVPEVGNEMEMDVDVDKPPLAQQQQKQQAVLSH